MNEIISTLERAQERALAEFPVTAYQPNDPDDLTCQAVVSLGLKYLHQTIFIFRHARKLKQELDKPGPFATEQLGPMPSDTQQAHQERARARRKEQDASD